MLGAVLIGTLEQSLFRLGISEFWLNAVLGLLILLAVASDAVILQWLRVLWGRAELKLVAPVSGEQGGRGHERAWPAQALGNNDASRC